ncbi:MAG: hypothetical protein D6814_06340, partial [Calditrichaeota bacterium]
QSLDRVRHDVDESAARMHEIAGQVKRLLMSDREIGQKAENLARMARETSSGMKSLVKTADELCAQADQLEARLSGFTLEDPTKISAKAIMPPAEPRVIESSVEVPLSSNEHELRSFTQPAR